MSKYIKNCSLIVLIVFFIVVRQAEAGIDSCTASFSPSNASSGSTHDFSVNITNNSTSNGANWIQISRPGGEVEIIAVSAQDWSPSVDDGTSVILSNGALGPSESFDLTVNAMINSATEGNWTVRISDTGSGEGGINCSGNLGFTTSENEDSGDSGGSSFSISGIGVTGSVTSATINWNTDVPASSVINYGINDSYGSNVESSELVSSHSLGISGLSSNTTYHFRVTSVDGSSNSVSSGDNTFTTSEDGVVTSVSTSTSSSTSRVIPTPTLPPDKSPPLVYVTTDLSKPVAKSPVVSGRVTDDRNIEKIEFSIDGGQNWFISKFSKSSDQKIAYYSFTPNITEDGNYEILVRGTDGAKNTANSQNYTLIFDRIPPKIGGSVITSGPQILGANSNGFISIPSHVNYSLLFSSIGGAIDITILASPSAGTKANSLKFTANKNEHTNIWTSNIKFENSGKYSIFVEAIDGAGNTTVTNFAPIHVLKSGFVTYEGKTVKDVSISLYYFDEDRHEFRLWDGKAYSQNNPTKTDMSGSYSFMLPKGKYYAEVSMIGYKKVISDIFSVSTNTILNSDFELRKHPSIKFGYWEMPYPFASSVTQEIELKTENTSESNRFSDETIGKKIDKVNLISDSKPITSDYFKGKRTILGFTNSWLPQSQLVIEALESKIGYQTAIVMPNETDSSIQTYRRRGNYKMPFIADKDGELLGLLRINMLPFYVSVDEKGIVKELNMGVSSIR